jgi:TAT-translocated FGD2 family F420-dependent dehydrogenase
MQTWSKPRFYFTLSHEQFSTRELIDLGLAAERAGFDGISTSDHFQPWQDNQGHAGMAWVTLAALARSTTRLQLGTAVTCPTYRYQPAIVAQAFATLSQLAPGRIYLGVGSGEALNELAASGGWGEFEERTERMVEAVQLIRELWTGERVEHQGRYYQVQGKLYDPPAQPIPLYIAASGKHAMNVVGRHGDGLISDPESVQDQELRTAYEQAVRDAGKDPQNMSILVEQFVIAGDQEEGRRWAPLWRFHPRGFSKDMLYDPDPRSIQRKAQEIPLEETLQGWTVSPDPAVHVQALRGVLESGVSAITIHSPQQDQQRVIEFFGRDVLPRLR